MDPWQALSAPYTPLLGGPPGSAMHQTQNPSGVTFPPLGAVPVSVIGKNPGVLKTTCSAFCAAQVVAASMPTANAISDNKHVRFRNVSSFCPINRGQSVVYTRAGVNAML